MNATMVKEIVGIGAVGSILTYLKSIPMFIWSKVKMQFTVNLDLMSNSNGDGSECVIWLEQWLGDYKEKIYRNLKGYHKWSEAKGDYIYVLTKDVEYVPAWFKFEGKRLLIRCHKRETQNGGEVYYDYFLTFFTRDASIITHFMDMIQAHYIGKRSDKVVSMIFRAGEWRKTKTITNRPWESVILPEGDNELLKTDIDNFVARKALYTELNITHKRGYLFEGVPGSGKSSIANAIATYLKWNLYAFNKTDIKSGTLSEAFADIRTKSVVLLEDIDTYKINRGTEDEAADTGDWLNWLDGINSPEDCIFVMTTNFVEKLDPALIRDGRVDFSMHFGYATEYQIRESFKRFHLTATDQEIEDFVARHKDKNVVMADIQNDLFKLYVPEWRGLEALKEHTVVEDNNYSYTLESDIPKRLTKKSSPEERLLASIMGDK